MAEIQLSNYFSAVTLHDGISANTSAPVAATDRIHTGEAERMRVYVSYTGSVTAGNLVLWSHDGSAWYQGDTTALGGSAGGNEFFDLSVGRATRVHLQLTGYTGTGTVTVKAEGIGSN